MLCLQSIDHQHLVGGNVAACVTASPWIGHKKDSFRNEITNSLLHHRRLGLWVSRPRDPRSLLKSNHSTVRLWLYFACNVPFILLEVLVVLRSAHMCPYPQTFGVTRICRRAQDWYALWRMTGVRLRGACTSIGAARTLERYELHCGWYKDPGQDR